MTVVQFPTKSVLPEEPEFVFSMEVFQEVDGSYVFEISEHEDEELDDDVISAILYRASNQLSPLEVVIDLEDDI